MPDTIAAIATPQLPSAIGILRLSGPDTRCLLERVFRAKNGRSMADQPRRAMVYGDLLDREGRIIDHVLCVLFPGPDSYTGEDCAELHCHGSPVVLNEGLAALFAAGARQAKGGEFTRRAFLNGRMDLLQAEAVADLVDAETAEAARNAALQLSGNLSRGVDGIYDDLMALLSRFYAVVDYPDEDIDEDSREQMLDTLRRAENRLAELQATFSRGQVLKTGVPAVILGRPNVGKSSLLNALAGYDRAIVTDVAGTTRDTVEEKIRVGHVLLRLIDTAGIRSAADAVEAQGVARSRDAARQASLALLVLDGSGPLTDEDEAAIAVAEAVPHLLVAVNKSDLPRRIDVGRLADRFDHVVSVSAKTGEGLAILTDAIAALYPAGGEAQGVLLTNARQADAVSRALESVKSSRAALRIGMTPDVVLTDAEAALHALGELNGRSVREDLVSTIFSRFCVGK
ncbi:MAG: tRNA uridine-5-carboxymethylaminomethyl(34) synthesis GTPase MnmE [Ruminococcaceae bacterium]|jgi:tRNA modification GTPase|nr:tRNA uridine-5-carboxymethylaminomethyl(34) synthesis GTPase MnmE [Oscillospiraceae bacterium]